MGTLPLTKASPIIVDYQTNKKALTYKRKLYFTVAS